MTNYTAITDKNFKPITDANPLPVVISDGTAGISVNADGTLNVKVVDGDGDGISLNADGSINTKLIAGNSVVGSVKIQPDDTIKAYKVVLSAGVASDIKVSAGYVYAISTALTDLMVQDDTVIVWSGNYSAGTPFYCATNIKLSTVTGGTAYIVVK